MIYKFVEAWYRMNTPLEVMSNFEVAAISRGLPSVARYHEKDEHYVLLQIAPSNLTDAGIEEILAWAANEACIRVLKSPRE